MILRVQTPDGIKRLQIESDSSCLSLLQQLLSSLNLSNLDQISLYTSKDKKNRILGLERRYISEYGLKHGDLLFADVNNLAHAAASVRESKDGASSSSSSTNTTSKQESANVFRTNSLSSSEDEVDIKLWSMSGLIERPKSESLCRHGPNGRCLHCTPLEPYDEAHLKELKIKHMSFHSYLRKITRGADKGKFAFLEDISCRIKAGCREHLPWPQGICTKCQPTAVTLNRQEYRHVDNIVFENPSIVERFLDYWRKTSHQRIGYLYGKYEIHNDVPLGIKATVVAIYEPMQESSSEHIKLILPDPRGEMVETIASQLGLQKVGWIFTDLLPLDRTRGTVKHLRHSDTYFLSAQECIMAGSIQNAYPNPCRLSNSGFFGSKSVTVCVTGNSDNQIHMEGYQVSNQCMALVRDNCLIPTKDAPELGYVKETSKEQYVPDVFYKEKDNFGNEVTKIARPLPIEYLLVDVPASTPVEPKRMFNVLPSKKCFPIENRSIEGHLQSIQEVSSYLSQFTDTQVLEAMSDFHLLIYIASQDPSVLEEMPPLFQAIRMKDTSTTSAQVADQWSKQSLAWLGFKSTLVQREGSFDSVIPDASHNGQAANPWNCSYCTYENRNSSSSCEICGLPKNQE